MAMGKLTAVLLHSPFLGPASLQPLAGRLSATGITTLVPDLRDAVISAPVHLRLVHEFVGGLSSAATTNPLVLIGHSGAGPLLPSFAEAAEDRVAALIYLDAELPTPGRSWEETAPVELVDELRSRARHGRLPPWHSWFDPDLLATLVPDDALRDSMIDEEPEVASTFLTDRRSDADWAGPAGYIQLSAPYAVAADQAEERGWPVRRIETHHLAPLTRPAAIADALIDILSTLTR